MNYCPRCGSRLFQSDDEYMQLAGVCSYCVTWDSTPDKRFKNKYLHGKSQATPKPKRKKED
jgi:hypothetical protein